MKHIVFLGLLFSFSAHAFTLVSSNPHRFNHGEVKVHTLASYHGWSSCRDLDMSEEELLQLVDQAMQMTWNRAGARIYFSAGQTQQSATTEAIYISCWDLNVLAHIDRNNIHRVWLKSYGDGRFDQLSRSLQLRQLAQLIGHALGIGSNEVSGSLMNPREFNQVLNQDDIQAINSLY